MRKLGRKRLTFQLKQPLAEVPAALAPFALERSADGLLLTYGYDAKAERTGVNRLLEAMAEAGVAFFDFETKQNSLEEIFVDLVKERA